MFPRPFGKPARPIFSSRVNSSSALWILIAICMVYYFGALQGKPVSDIIIILVCSIVGILGSYAVAWFGIRINTVANSRAAFASLSGDPLNIVNICLRSGMSVGLLLVSIELFFMIIILAYIPKELAGPCFIGFAIGESSGCFRSAYLRWYLHEDCRHRLRPDENRFPSSRRRSEKPGCYCRLYGR